MIIHMRAHYNILLCAVIAFGGQQEIHIGVIHEKETNKFCPFKY